MAASPSELPDLVKDLFDLSKRYLEQETIEPARKLGRVAGLGMLGGLLFAISAWLLAFAAYYGFIAVLPDGPWWLVLARGLTVVVAAGGAGLIAWGMTRR